MRAGVVAGLAALLGCAGFEIRSDFDRETDFSAYRAFAWLEPPVREPQELSEQATAQEVLLHNSLLDKRVRSAVTAGLEQRGLRLAPPGEADLLLRYRVGVDEHTEIAGSSVGASAYYWRYPYYVSPGFDTYWTSRRVRDGILILDMVEADSGQLVWRGWAVGRNPDGYFREDEIDGAVTGLLRQFPPSRGDD